MPYIKLEDRPQYESYIKNVVTELQAGNELDEEEVAEFAKKVPLAGHANYIISSIIWRLFDAKPSYTYGNDLISAVEDVKSCLANKNAWTDQASVPFYVFLKRLCYGFKGNFKGVRGMLACVVLEFYRRRLGIYEDQVIGKNGDI